ncbi:MAG: selenium cofactor biosynthesis protein YqeC [Anaerolineales bacterium]
MPLSLRSALRLPEAPCLALIGAGGKSTALFQLARAYPPPVLLSATTHLSLEQCQMADHHLILLRPGILPWEGVILVTGAASDPPGKMRGVEAAVLGHLRLEAQQRHIPFLLECDGSRQKPLKAPAEHEPPIPDFVEIVIMVVGLSGVGQPLEETYVHRAARFAELSGLKMGERVSAEALARLLNHPQGGLKNIPRRARRVVLLNQADDADRQALGARLAGMLLPLWDAVLIARLQTEEIFAVHERVAGIVLAAGASARFGKPKQVLEWEGKPLVRHVGEQALQAGLKPLLVVTGNAHAEVEAALRGLEVKLVFNPAWQSGQASSIRAGIEALRHLDPQVGAAIFLLADQPGVNPQVLQALVEHHAGTLVAVVAPLVGGQRANPVLFDRVTFDDLLKLEGDQGGRAIFSRYPPQFLPWHDEALLFDIDTPQDVERWQRR